MILVLHIDDTPSVLSASYLLAINNDTLLAANYGEWDDLLDRSIRRPLFIIQLVVVVWVHLEVVESELLLYSLLERASLLQGKRIGLCDNWHDIDHIRQFLEDDYVDRLQCVTGWLNEEQAAVNSGVLDIALSLSGELFSEVCRVLVFDVLDDRVPTARVSIVLPLLQSIRTIYRC